MLEIINKKTNEIVNIIHLQGKTIESFPKTIEIIQNTAEINPINDKKLSIVSCWTEDKKCILKQQLDRFNIKLINALPNNYNYLSNWYMPNKIKYYINCLENQIETEYVLILDGYDVLVNTFDNIINKFKKTNYRILFNATHHNYPNEEIDILYNRKKYLPYGYFNAGCCIGYRKDLIKFYKESLEYINIYNPYESEQKILRHTFAKYSNDKYQKFIGIDYKQNIFSTMGKTTTEYFYDESLNKHIIYIRNNYEDF